MAVSKSNRYVLSGATDGFISKIDLGEDQNFLTKAENFGGKFIEH